MDRSRRTSEPPRPDASSASIPIDDERPVEANDDTAEVTPPVDAPFEAPIDDLVEQRRTVRLEEPDER